MRNALWAAVAAAMFGSVLASGSAPFLDGASLSSLSPIGSARAATRETRIPDDALATAAGLRETALASELGYRITESLTTEVGPRLAGSESDARAVAWAEAKFRELGYDRVWKEPVTFPKWVRRSESAAVVGTSAQPLAITALGGSPGGTVEAAVVRFADLAALEAAPAGSLAGRIAFVDYRMERARDGSGYGPGSRVRSRGPSAGSLNHWRHTASTCGLISMAVVSMRSRLKQNLVSAAEPRPSCSARRPGTLSGSTNSSQAIMRCT